jgi:broad specificity phosphatase PhoE
MTTIIFVRHAEAGGAMGDPQDPGLTPAGRARAETLAKALSTSGISAVYTSQYNRTRETGKIVADACHAAVTSVPVGANRDADAAALIAQIEREHPGQTVLVVGHSNTVPLMVQRASGITVDPIADTEFDHLYIVSIHDGIAHLVQARY